MATVVIIGGGVTGLSTAYHLALRKFGRIVLLDKGPVGDGSSSRAAAIITGLLWSDTGVLARKIALQRYRELSDELPGYRFNDVGCLNWFDPESWPARQELLTIYDRNDAPYEIIDAKEMQHRWPAMRPPEDFTGLHDPLGGYSEPHEFIPALANQCRRLGVEILEAEMAQAVLTRDGRIVGVATRHGVIHADAVVSTSYAWINQVLQSAGVRLPVKSFVHQRYVTRPLPDEVRIPAINANPLYGYVRPASGKRLLLGIETADREEFIVDSPGFQMNELSADAGLRDTLMNSFSKVVPAMKDAKWEYERVGIITFSADNEPILGPVAAVKGLYVGVAFHSGGFAYSPVTGMLLADFVAEGKPRLDVSAFSPDRFNPAETDDYLSHRVQQKNAARRRH